MSDVSLPYRRPDNDRTVGMAGPAPHSITATLAPALLISFNQTSERAA